VQRLDVLMIATHGERLGIGQSQLEFAGEFVHAHMYRPLVASWRAGQLAIGQKKKDYG
jgi:hypothetical protein